MVRKAIEYLYKGRCMIHTAKATFDETTKQTSFSDSFSDEIPCRLSVRSFSPASDGKAAAVHQEIKLFLAPEVEIKAGARVIVTQNGKTDEYKAASAPAKYSNHQEINLRLVDDWA